MQRPSGGIQVVGRRGVDRKVEGTLMDVHADGTDQQQTQVTFLRLKVVFNSEGRVFEVNAQEPTKTLLHRAAAEFGVAGEAQNLVLRFGTTPLDPETRLADFGLPQDAELFLERRTPPRGGLTPRHEIGRAHV